MASLLTLTGPSGAGKSTFIREILKHENTSFRPVVVPKYTTRPPREKEKAVKGWLRETISVKKLPKSCDLVYEQYGVRYGLTLRSLYDALAKGSSPIVILNDVRAVEDIRTLFGPLVRSIFLFRESPSFAKHEELADKRGGVDELAVKKRFDKAQSIYRIYIENIYLFDHVVLNHGLKNDLHRQITEIVKGLAEEKHWPLRTG